MPARPKGRAPKDTEWDSKKGEWCSTTKTVIIKTSAGARGARGGRGAQGVPGPAGPAGQDGAPGQNAAPTVYILEADAQVDQGQEQTWEEIEKIRNANTKHLQMKAAVQGNPELTEYIDEAMSLQRQVDDLNREISGYGKLIAMGREKYTAAAEKAIRSHNDIKSKMFGDDVAKAFVTLDSNASKKMSQQQTVEYATKLHQLRNNDRYEEVRKKFAPLMDERREQKIIAQQLQDDLKRETDQHTAMKTRRQELVEKVDGNVSLVSLLLFTIHCYHNCGC